MTPRDSIRVIQSTLGTVAGTITWEKNRGQIENVRSDGGYIYIYVYIFMDKKIRIHLSYNSRDRRKLLLLLLLLLLFIDKIEYRTMA